MAQWSCSRQSQRREPNISEVAHASCTRTATGVAEAVEAEAEAEMMGAEAAAAAGASQMSATGSIGGMCLEDAALQR